MSLALILTFALVAGAQSIWSRAGDGISWYWGEAKTGTIKSVVNTWDRFAGNSCGDYTPRSLQAIRAPSCSVRGELDDAVELAFFSAGARMQIQDDNCQLQRFTRISNSPSHVGAFTRDLQAKVPDLRARYKEIQDLKAEIESGRRVWMSRADGPISSRAADYWIKNYGPKIDYLAKKTQEFNALVFSNPLAHFEAGQKFLMDVVAKGRAPTPSAVRATYLEGVRDVQQDKSRWLARQSSPGQFTLDRSDKVALLKSGHTETWFKPDAQSAEEAKRVMCNISRVYVKGETVANWTMTIGSYALGLEGCLVKVAWAARFAAVAGRARMGLVSLETMNMLSWGLASAAAVDSAVKRCKIPRTQVAHSGPQCSIDPNSEVVMMESANCTLGLAIAGGTMAFAAGTSAIGRLALERAAQKAAPVVAPIVTPIRNAAQKIGKPRQ